MSWWWEQIISSMVGGALAAFTWLMLVSLGKEIAVKGWGWGLGIGIVGGSNALLWLFLGIVQPNLWLWVLLFLLLNSMDGYWLTNLPLVTIPPLWAIYLHPLAITLMLTLLGGATAKFT
ncbi:MAG: hypothetical protein RMK91_11175 [Pseudanabaenaceae cyanobacterium SKYGB_i_bin29]|nr:hypothetical protein [Pseudanabaenaceae cyanobacterium SKYG29]MDW8422416.1 hypothetical protein [Pseudanabaenaceae cyanobacterium SKYGB_i_bin29]